MMFFYTVFLHIFALFALPRMAYLAWRRGKYRESFAFRFGRRFPKIEKGGRSLIWIHAVSFGEVKAVAALAKRLKCVPNAPLLLISTLTETGYREAKRALPEADYHVYLPFDLPYIVGPIVARVAPDLVLLCETDFWWNFLRKAKACGARLFLVNGKLSERSFRRWRGVTRIFPSCAKRLFSLFEKLCLQGPTYAERFRALGVENFEITGNLKLESNDPWMTPEEASEWRKRLGIGVQEQVLTIGSTHSGEEEMMVPILRALWDRFPHLKVVLAPRHPERFHEVAEFLERRGIEVSRFSREEHGARLVLLDVLGMLRRTYQISDVAIVGGSFVSHIGGHNILEPSYYGVPVICGPHMWGQVDFLDLLLTAGAGFQVREEELFLLLEELLAFPEKRREVGRRGLYLVDSSRGALEKTLKSFT